MKIDFALYQKNDFGALMAPRLPLTYTVNTLNNRLGQPDLYPYVLTLAVMAKLRFVHGLIHAPGAIEELS